MSLYDVTVTNAGAQLLAAASAGDGTLHFTRAQLGSGVDTGSLNDKTALVAAVTDASLGATSVSGNIISVPVLFSNRTSAGYMQAFELNEIGLFARLDSGAETMIAYSNAGTEEDGVSIPGDTLIEFTYLFKIAYSGAQGLTISAEALDYVTRPEFNTHVADGSKHFGINPTTNVDGTLYRGDIAPTGTMKLNYSGYFEATRVYGSYYSDYAECFDVQDGWEPGIVVSIDRAGRIARCQQDKCPTVIGVVSDDYYMCIGKREGGNNCPIALAGKARVYVTGGCHPGDTIVSAGEGIARALKQGEEAPPGAILGMALEEMSEAPYRTTAQGRRKCARTTILVRR